jgi:crotonobetainyl-CoA:carnitine CoA-transferase CaiB-like acyl-CoA transferase
VRAIKPDIVFVSISGFGESGPYADQRVYDPIIQALSGLADIQADRETGTPRMVRTIVPDKTTAVTAAQAITAALLARERTGKGQHVRLSMLDTMVAYLWPEGMSALSWVGKETDPARGQMGLDLVFETKDGHITAGAVTNAEWVGLCHALGREDLLDDERFKTPEARVRNVADRRRITGEEIRKWTSAEILERLKSADVPCAPILDRRAVLDNEQVVENGIIEIHDHPVLGKVRQPRPAARFDETPAKVKALAPFLGADNAAVLRDLGYSDADVERLRSDGVLGPTAE